MCRLAGRLARAPPRVATSLRAGHSVNPTRLTFLRRGAGSTLLFVCNSRHIFLSRNSLPCTQNASRAQRSNASDFILSLEPHSRRQAVRDVLSRGVGGPAATNVRLRGTVDATDQIPLRLVLYRRVFKFDRRTREAARAAELWGRCGESDGVPERRAGTHGQTALGGAVEGAPTVRRHGAAQSGGAPRDRPRGRPFKSGVDERRGPGARGRQPRRHQGGGKSE